MLLLRSCQRQGTNCWHTSMIIVLHDPQQAQAGYDYFMQLAQELGLQLCTRMHKCVPPTTRFEWFGYDIDTVAMTTSVPSQKLKELELECTIWLDKKRASKRMIQ